MNKTINATLSPLAGLLVDQPTAKAVMVNGPQEIWIELPDGTVRCDVSEAAFADRGWADRLAADYGDGRQVHAVVTGGHRLDALVGANVFSGMAVTLRRSDRPVLQVLSGGKKD